MKRLLPLYILAGIMALNPVRAVGAELTRQVQANQKAGVDIGLEDYLHRCSDTALLARMLFGEARNCSRQEKVAVAYTALNRAKDGKKWNGSTIEEAILKKYQYSCFNQSDPNRRKLIHPARYDRKAWIECLDVADEVLRKKATRYEATHYHTKTVCPAWTRTMRRTGGNKEFKHIFYKEK